MKTKQWKKLQGKKIYENWKKGEGKTSDRCLGSKKESIFRLDRV